MPSSLTTSTLTSVETASVSASGGVQTIVLSGGKFTSFSPNALIYTAIGGDGNYHLYKLDVSNAAVVPTRQQVSSFSLVPGANAFDASCLHSSYTTVTDPASAFFIVERPTAGTCGTGAANVFVLVRIGDSSSTAPTVLPSTFRPQHPSFMYSSTGAFVGMVTDNAATNNLEYYAASKYPGFASPTSTIASAITWGGRVTVYTDRLGTVLSGGSVDFVAVTVGTQQQVWRINATGSSLAVWTTSGSISGGLVGAGSAVYDSTNIYFIDVSTANVVTVLKTPIASAAAATSIYSLMPGVTDDYSIVDSDGTNLIVHHGDFSNLQTHQLLTLAVAGPASQTPQTLVSINASTVTGMDAFLDYGSGNLFVNTESMNPPVTSPAPRADAYHMPTCARPCTPIAGAGGLNTAFLQPDSGLSGASTSGTKTLLELTNVTASAPSGLVGPGMSVKTFSAPTPQTTTSVTQLGSPYVQPAGADAYLIFPASNTVFEGFSFSPVGGTSTGLALDLTSSKIITIAPANQSVQPAF